MRRRFRAALVLSALVTVFLPPLASAQPWQRPNRPRVVHVVCHDGGAEERGRLVNLGREAVTLDIRGVRQRFVLDDVLRIDEERHDSLVNGAIIGALVAGSVCALTCRQEPDSEVYRRLGIAVVAGFGGLVGAGVDMFHTSRTTIYPRPEPMRGRRAAQIGWRLRF